MSAHFSLALCLCFFCCTQTLGAQAGIRPDTTELSLLGLDLEAEAVDIVRALGRPDSVRSYEHPNNVGVPYERFYYRDVLVFMGPDGLKLGLKFIAPGLFTRRGLAVGDSVQRAIELYGAPDARNEVELRWRVASGNPGDKAQFLVEVRRGRVASIFAGYVTEGLRRVRNEPFAPCTPSRVPVTLRSTDKRAAAASGNVTLRSAPDSAAVLDVSIRVHDLPAVASFGRYAAFVVWVATPTLEQFWNLGAIENERPLTARLRFPYSLFLVSAELDVTGTKWAGPILLAGRCS